MIADAGCIDASTRGCDGVNKYDPSKAVLWALRADVLVPSQLEWDPEKGRSFMGYHSKLQEKVEEFLSGLDHYPFHFVTHLMHAAEIIGWYHPDQMRRAFWDSHLYNHGVWNASQSRIPPAVGFSPERPIGTRSHYET